MAPESILFCPGIGANGDMFDEFIEKLNHLSIKVQPTYMEFIQPLSKKESLSDYAKRVFSVPEIKNKKFDMVVACSFGGMLYQEAYRQNLVQETKSVLICTAHSGNDINPLFFLSMPLANYLPRFLYRPIQIFIAILYPVIRFNRPWARKFSRMFLKTRADVFFTCPIMIHGWNTEKDFVPSLPRETIQFHGTSDPLISYKNIIKKRIPEFPLYKKNHIIFATEADLIVNEMASFLHKKTV